MKTIFKIAILGGCLVLMFMLDVPPNLPLQVQLVPDAHAIFGVRRRAFRRGVVIGSSVALADAASASAVAAESRAAAPPPSPAPQPAAAPPPPPPAAATGKPLPLGTVVHTLPAGCTSTPVGGVNYFYCSGNFYRAVFQGNQLVYVTAKP